jgi:hypothetical protein
MRSGNGGHTIVIRGGRGLDARAVEAARERLARVNAPARRLSDRLATVVGRF